MTTHEVPVVIVGAGPAGLTTALVLARYGVESLLVERRLEPSSHPRATVVSTRSMEHVRAWGLAEQVLDGGIEVDWLMWFCETLADASSGTGVEVGLPTRAQAALISPCAPECVGQDHLERVLLTEVRSLAPAEVALGSELVELGSKTDGVRVVLRDRDGQRREVRARYLVAADGAWSTVRTALGIPLVGPDDVLAGAGALVRAPLWSLVGEHRYGAFWVERPGAEGLFLPAGGDRWIYGRMTEPGAPPRESLGEAVERIRQAAGIRDLPVRTEGIRSFSSAAQLAERFRDRNVFLIGDAAHRVTPRGGTGMNTAIHDGHDLAWKLAWVINGWAGDELLDSYELERRPVAEHNVARSADPEGSRRSAEDELRVDLGGRVAHHWVVGPNGRVSTIDLLGPGVTLLTSPEDSGWRTAAESLSGGPPIVVHALDAITARALGILDAGALLLRPDGVPADRLSRVASPRQLLEDAIAGIGGTGASELPRAAAA
jgi:2-polyprenyl-6-methoxyphenol hydroxylase-like FAD-dependent oxidoreductase